MANTDLSYSWYSMVPKLKTKADELGVDGRMIKSALLILEEQAQRRTMAYTEGCGIDRQVLEELRPMCIVSIASGGIENLIKASDMLIKYPEYPKGLPEGLSELLTLLGYLEDEEDDNF